MTWSVRRGHFLWRASGRPLSGGLIRRGSRHTRRQTFLSTLSTFMMVKGQVRPSSTEAQYVRDIARDVARDTDSPGGTLSCRLTETTCFGPAPSALLQVTPLPDLGRSADLRTAARYPATVAADGPTGCIMEVWLADMSTFLRFAVVRTHALSPLCVRFRYFDRVRPAPQLEPSHLVPAGSHYSQVPDVGLGHSRRRRKIPRLLRSALLHKPLHSAHSRSAPPACWQCRSYEVSNRTGRAPRTQPDEHVTLPPTSCCQRSKCRTSRMMRPLPPPNVIGQPSQEGYPRRAGKRPAREP